jgi:hypothetical protein
MSHKDSYNVLAYINTKGRYLSTLPLTIQSIALQTTKPNNLLIFDDNDKPTNLPELPTYRNLFYILKEKGIDWEVRPGMKSGQHKNHEIANTMAEFDLAWRIDDDELPEANVLEKLISHMATDVGAIAGAVLVPGKILRGEGAVKLEDMFTLPNVQWMQGRDVVYVEHLYSSFLYRTNVVHYESRLSPMAHREETIFSHELFRKGFRLIVDQGAVTWHLRHPEGGIRNYPQEFGLHDEFIFKAKLKEWKTEFPFLVLLDNDINAHSAFLSILPEVETRHSKITIACNFPEIFSSTKHKIVQAETVNQMSGVEKYNIYDAIRKWNWQGSLADAFRKMYL